MKITIIRHLPTSWNKEGLLQGKKDIDILLPLSEMEKAKIIHNKKVLNEILFDVVLVSTLKRTKQTAEVYDLHEYGVEPLLNEFDFGTYEGQKKEKLMLDTLNKWRENPKSVQLGENISDLERRIKKFIKKYKANEHILIFAHGAWLRALISMEKNKDINQMNTFEIENNKLITLTIEGEF